ncbi:MAG: amidohydrolase [Phycisphaeraceae bacterium]|nr:MAG: amidohydrolase [Phycisphaeraceae bacterium]
MTGDTTTFTKLRDAHIHLHWHGEELSQLNLADCASREECLERISAFASDKPKDQWIIASAARTEGWIDPMWPTASQLDDAAGGRPCFIRSIDHHSLCAGNEALRRAKITANTDPGRGAVVLDQAGAPTGVLLEEACFLISKALPEPTPAQRKETLRAAIRDLAARGFVEVHDMLSEPWLGPALAEIDDEDGLPLKVLLHAPLADIRAAADAAPSYQRDNIRLAGAKLFSDGALNSRTAWMLEPYADPLPDNPRGVAMYTPAELLNAVRTCDAIGLPMAIHAIGDGAVRAVLDAIEQAAPKTPGFRIEHCQFVDEADIPRFATMNIIASMQPCHLLTDIEALRRLTPHRLHRAFPVRDLIESARSAGRDPAELVWLGSDTPVVPPNPQDNIQGAVNRRRAGMPKTEAIAPEQAITRKEALACMKAVTASKAETMS